MKRSLLKITYEIFISKRFAYDIFIFKRLNYEIIIFTRMYEILIFNGLAKHLL
jgi:hypothetical protein